MSDGFENDELLERLRTEDPASGERRPERPGERDAVRAHARALLDSPARPARPPASPWRRRLPIAGAVAGLVLAAVLALVLGGSSSRPALALAINKGERYVTLTLNDPAASDTEMNQELADAGIDRVRVRSVPGPPRDVGVWAGYVELGPVCKGGVSRFGYDVDIPIARPFNRANSHGAENLFDLTLPRQTSPSLGFRGLIAEEAGNQYSKSTVRLPTDAVDDPRNAAKVLVPIRPRSSDDGVDANDIGVDQLVALGGVFAQYGEAVKSGHTSCADFGMKPRRTPSRAFPPPGKRVREVEPRVRPDQGHGATHPGATP